MQRAETVIPTWICFRFALQYNTHFECANVHPRTPSEVHFMKLITKVHRTGYFGNTGFGVLKFIFERGASSFHNPRPARGSHCVRSYVCARVCMHAHPFYFVRFSVLHLSRAPFSKINENEARPASRTLSIEIFFFFPELIKGRAARVPCARVTKSDSITCICGKTIYSRGSFAAKLRFVTSLTRILN